MAAEPLGSFIIKIDRSNVGEILIGRFVYIARSAGTVRRRHDFNSVLPEVAILHQNINIVAPNLCGGWLVIRWPVDRYF